MAKTDQPTTIKKYANRRLYNTGTSTYVTLEDLAAMVKDGEDFLVYDAKTGDDITRSVLAQIIFEQENKAGQNLLPTTFLRQLIRFYGDRSRTVDRHADPRAGKIPQAADQHVLGNAVRAAGRTCPPQHGNVSADLLDVQAVRAAARGCRRRAGEGAGDMQDRLERMSKEPKKEEGA